MYKGQRRLWLLQVRVVLRTPAEDARQLTQAPSTRAIGDKPPAWLVRQVGGRGDALEPLEASADRHLQPEGGEHGVDIGSAPAVGDPRAADIVVNKGDFINVAQLH